MTKERQREIWRKATRKYHTSHDEKGLCHNCPEPAYKYDRCPYHYQKYVLMDNKRKKRRKENGQCTSCGQPLIEEDIGFKCINCRENLHPIHINETLTKTCP